MEMTCVSSSSFSLIAHIYFFRLFTTLLYLLPPRLPFFRRVSSVTVMVRVCVCSVRCQEGVETHRWSGWFPLSEIWVEARSQISGPRS